MWWTQNAISEKYNRLGILDDGYVLPSSRDETVFCQELCPEPLRKMVPFQPEDEPAWATAMHGTKRPLLQAYKSPREGFTLRDLALAAMADLAKVGPNIDPLTWCPNFGCARHYKSDVAPLPDGEVQKLVRRGKRMIREWEQRRKAEIVAKALGG